MSDVCSKMCVCVCVCVPGVSVLVCVSVSGPVVGVAAKFPRFSLLLSREPILFFIFFSFKFAGSVHA